MNELLAQVPGGVQIVALIVAIAAVVSAFMPDTKVPSWLAWLPKVINVLGMNVLKAKNDPNAQ